MNFFDRLFRSPLERLERSLERVADRDNTTTIREAALQEILGIYAPVLFTAESNNQDLIGKMRNQIIPLIERGLLNTTEAPDSKTYPSILISEESHPELHRLTARMNEQLNERHGTQYPMPGVVIVDNPNQIPSYSPSGDLIILSRSTVEEGGAPSMIAHELAERQGSLLREDLSARLEIHFRAKFGMEIPQGLLDKHRANECWEDADAITLVGPDDYQRSSNNVFINARGPFSTDQLNEMSAGINRRGRPEHYPTDLEQNRMAAVLRDNPELLDRIRHNPNSIRIDGSCNITVVEERGPDTARVPQPVTNEPLLHQ